MDANAEFIVNIVDDDCGSRESIAALANSLKFATRLFASAQDFLDSYGGERGCVITDLRMPEMSGLDLLKALNDLDWSIPVIVVSGFAETSVVVEAMQRGAVTFLEKPYSGNDLWNVLRAAVKHDDEFRCESEERRAIASRLAELNADEQSVMELLVDGQSNKFIALHLGLGPRTVESKRHSVLQTMQLDSIAKLVQDVMITTRGRRPLKFPSHR